MAISFGPVALVYRLGNAATVGWVDWRTITFVLVGLSLVALFILIERRTASPLLPLRVLLDRNRGAAFAAVGIAGIGSSAVFLFLTYFLQENLGFTPIRTGIGLVPMVGMIIASSAIAVPALVPRLGPLPLVPLGCLMTAAAMALLASINDNTHYASGVLPALLLFGFGFGFGFGLISGPAQNAATSGTASDEAGVASARQHRTADRRIHRHCCVQCPRLGRRRQLSRNN